MAVKHEAEIGGQAFSMEAGKLAEQADGAVVVRYGDSVVLATAVAAKEPREGADFFPLTVDYEERMYAAGKIPGGFIKRESRPSEAAILAMRLTDRPIRPLFPKGYYNDVQVVLTVLSTDQENDPDILALNGASAALSISHIPFQGPVGAVRVGRIGGEFVTNPTNSQLAESELDLVVAGTREAVMMVEAGAKILPESVMADAIAYGHQELQKSIELQDRLVASAGTPKKAPFIAPKASSVIQLGEADLRRPQRVRRLRPRDDRHEARERLHRRRRRPARAGWPDRRYLRVAGEPGPPDRRAPGARHQDR